MMRLNCLLVDPIIFKIANCLLLNFRKLFTEYKMNTNEKSSEISNPNFRITPMVLSLSTTSSAGWNVKFVKIKNTKTEKVQLMKWKK